MKHLLSTADLDIADAVHILDTAGSMAATQAREIKKLPTLRGQLLDLALLRRRHGSGGVEDADGVDDVEVGGGQQVLHRAPPSMSTASRPSLSSSSTRTRSLVEVGRFLPT